ncbi:glycosyl hydrolase, family 31 [Alloscardovia omnicolens F0580]|uniref:alpha-D-xyloside xylohydrolase n=1 Tax=Alloscardovia omnicolens F0580 TaxID=1321816 RepID=U1SLH0_9BIFI|nr:alpha-xylosidase [Alloscardovia omnicolens]ERH31512.1 glycosyl hydrolase, family 31 [Alloscardovia omnicolens F0580]
MKFTNGYWLLRDGVNAIYAREAYELHPDTERKEVNIVATSMKINDRANTLNLPIFDVTLSSPAEGVIRVRSEHWSGATQYPGFPLNEEDVHNNPRVSVEAQGNSDGEAGEDGASVTLTSGELSARVVKGAPWNLSFEARGEELTSSASKSLARFALAEGAAVSAQPVGEFGVSLDGTARDESEVFSSIQLHLGVGEQVYGFGERFGTYIKNGQSIDIWNEDGGTASEQGYKDIPFYMTSRGYGVLVNNRGHVSYEVGSENTEAVQFSVPGEALDFCIIYGPTPKEILERYTALTGRPTRVPTWSYGLWLTTSFTTKYDEKTVSSFVDGMAERNIPLSAFHYDCYWMREFQWTDFEFDERFFGTIDQVEKSLRSLRGDKGLHVCVWLNPYLGQRGSAFKEALERGYLVKKPNGEVWQTDFWQAGMGLVDFTNLDARAWYKSKVKALLAHGVDAIKTDFGERVPRDVVWADGSPKLSMHNWYTQLYNQTVFEALEETYGKGKACLYARSATVGGQMQPVHWGGDCESTFNGMAQSLRAGLSLTSSGFGFWSHDIGGFEGAFPDPAVYKRWIAFGMLGSHSRLHGSTVYRVPWLFDEEDEKNGVINAPGQSAVDVLRQFTLLKLELMPYLFELGLQPEAHGTPVMRSMFLEFPEDPTARVLDRQYMFGPSLLVAPVFSYSGDVEYYLPAGTWTNWFTGEKAESEHGVWRKENHAFDTVPLWVRDGSIIPTHPGATSPEYEYGKDAVLAVFGEAQVRVSEEDGSSVAFSSRVLEDGRTEVTSSDGRDFRARLGVDGELVASTHGVAVLE